MLQAVGSWKPGEGALERRMGPEPSAAGASQESSAASTRTLPARRSREGNWELRKGGQPKVAFGRNFPIKENRDREQYWKKREV